MSDKTLNGKTTDDKLEELAVMVAAGFADTVSKVEFSGFRDEMYGFRDEMYGFRDEMYGFRNEMYTFRDDAKGRLFDLENDVRDIKRSISELTEQVNRFVAIVEAQQAEFRELRALIADLQNRMTKLEAR